MKFLLSAIVAVGSLALAIAAFAQSSSTAPSPSPSPSSSSSPSPSPPAVVQTNTAPAAPVAPSKRFACQAAAQGLKGQERQDQMQLCIAQARLDCLKQAIDQKIVGPQRRDFVQNCVVQ
jgi:hypothetical protein